jgi:hypothetical protein
MDQKSQSSIDAWLQASCRDAEGRGLPELRPLLEGLARSTAALREADRTIREAGLIPGTTEIEGGRASQPQADTTE